MESFSGNITSYTQKNISSADTERLCLYEVLRFTRKNLMLISLPND